MSQSIVGRRPALGPPWSKLRALGGAALAASALVSGAASADEVCISQAAKDALSQCPAGIAKPSAPKRPDVPIKAPPAAPPAKSNATPPKPPDPGTGQGPRTGRPGNAAVRSMQLLVAQIQQTEQLLAATPRSAPDRPGILRRLAEDYVELEESSFRTRTQAQIQISAIPTKGQTAAQAASLAKLVAERDKADKVLVGARKKAIEHYDKLQAEHPTFCTNPNAADPSKSTGCVDEVLYYLAYEHEQAGELEKARKVYLQLITKAPKSKYVATAYLAFGELYFNEAAGDPTKWALAAQAYNEVARYPLPDNKVLGYAEYKLAYVYWNQGDYQRALTAFKKAIEIGQQNPQLPNAGPLASAARRDLVTVYSLSGQPKKAYDFFRPLSGDAAAENKATLGMMDDLGHAYLDTGHYKETIELYQDLLSRDHGPKQCLYQGHIVEATLADKSGSKDDITAALEKQIEAYKKQPGQHPTDDVKKECANTTAELLAETAMAWHLEAVGSGGVRGTGDKKTMALAAQLYDTTLSTFDKEKFAGLTFPKIVKEDWPSRSKVAYLRADLLYSQKDWAKCGAAFDVAVREDPTGPDAASAAYAAVLCHYQVYLEHHKNGSDRVGNGRLPGAAPEAASVARKLAPKEITAQDKEMLGAFDRYLCYIQPPDDNAKDKEARDQYIDIKFARARMYFEAQHWEEAAWAFRDIALSYPKDDAALPAGQLYLESLNVLGTALEPNRPACLVDMGTDVAKLTQSFCADGKAKEHASDCAVLERVQRGVEGKVPEGWVKMADGMTGPEAMKLYEKAANAYVDLWKKYGEAACRDKAPGCEGNDVVLYNAARAYQAARLLAKAIGVRKILIDPQFNLQRTEPARKALYEIGANYQAIAVYDEAATYYERFASENGTMPKAPEALQDAIVLRLGLGQEKQALDDSELFAKTYGTQKPALAARVAFAIGAHYTEKGDFATARKRLSDAMSAIDQKAPLDVQIQAHALLGRAYQGLHNPSQAQAEFTHVKSAWSNPEAALKKLTEAYPDEAERNKNLGKTLTAVGEALFFFAEQKRSGVDKIRFPEYRGSGAKADVLKHVQTKVADWVKRKRAAIDEADREYQKITELTPPPPKWTVAGAARVGQMWSKFVAEFRAAPIPKEWKQDGPVPGIEGLTWQEVRLSYHEALDAASEPQKQKAKAAYERCLQTSVRYQHFDENARVCEKWLSKNYGNEYHLVDEFRGSPSRVAAGVGDKPLPVDMAGGFVKTDAPAADKGAGDKGAGDKGAGDKGAGDKGAAAPAGDKAGAAPAKGAAGADKGAAPSGTAAKPGPATKPPHH
jgi:tetratricopeptide (TPR) repeat protein